MPSASVPIIENETSTCFLAVSPASVVFSACAAATAAEPAWLANAVEDCSLAAGLSPVAEPSSPAAVPVVSPLAAAAPESEALALPCSAGTETAPSEPVSPCTVAWAAASTMPSAPSAHSWAGVVPKAIAKARSATRPRLATPRAIAPRRREARWRSSSNISICLLLSVLGALP